MCIRDSPREHGFRPSPARQRTKPVLAAKRRQRVEDIVIGDEVSARLEYPDERRERRARRGSVLQHAETPVSYTHLDVYKRQEADAANQELEAFSYSVAHDLRTPLRSIDGFSQAILEDNADQLDAEGKSNFARVRAAAQRMAHLIDDLLGLSRLCRGELLREDVDLTRIALSLIHI